MLYHGRPHTVPSTPAAQARSERFRFVSMTPTLRPRKGRVGFEMVSYPSTKHTRSKELLMQRRGKLPERTREESARGETRRGTAKSCVFEGHR